MNSASLRDLFFRNAHLLVLTILVIALAGASALSNLPRIEDPRITTRNALVITPFPGASAERVEALVTKKLEDELREVEEIKDVIATSRANISVISIALEDSITSDTNEQAFSRVRDKLSEAEALLPPGAGKPSFDDERGASAFSVLVGLSAAPGSQASMGMLTRLGEELADRLRSVPGAERVKVYGDTEEEITITLNRGELAAQGLSAQQVAARIAAADPKNAAGALRGNNRDLFLEVGGELDSVARIRNLVVREGSAGRQLRLGDVAEVEKRWREPPDSYAYLNGQRIVFVASASAENVRIDRWQTQADVVLADFAAGLDDGIVVDVLFRQNEYTEERLSSLSNNLLLGAGVVMLVVFFGLGWRAALIVGAALPLSASATLFGLTFFDQQIHQMSIFGMIIAIGLLIDNAIVVTDEIQRRLARGEDRGEAVARSVAHLFVPLLASTVTTVLGFMPIFLLPGNTGDFVGPIAISVVLALLASFLISMTIIAALAGRYVKRGEAGQEDDAHWWQRGIRFPAFNRLCERWLSVAFCRPLLTSGLALVLPVTGFLLAGTLDLQFFPPADRDQFEIEVRLQDDASLSRTRDVALEIESAVREFDGVTQLSWLIGGSHPQIYYNRIMQQDSNAAYAHAMVKAESADVAGRIVLELQTELDERFPEAQIIVAPFAQGPPVDAPVGFRISGPSLTVLAEKGEELRRVMYETEGITHTRTSISSRAKLKYAANQSDAERVGLTLDDIAFQMQGNLEGFTGGSVREDLEDLPVRIRYSDDVRGSLPDIASMPLLTNSKWVPADTLGDMRVEPESASITRRNGERVNVIHGWVAPGSLPIEISNDILANLDAAGFSLPPGYTLRLEGDSDAQQEAVGNLMIYLPILVMLMVTTLILSFGSASAAAIVGLVALLSAGLGMLSLWLGGYNLGFNPLLGSAGLIGIAINGSIVVLAALRANADARAGDVDAVVSVTMHEARHVLATTATTIGGFLPLLVFAGGEFWPPLAVVIAGGVGFAVTLSLLMTPALFVLLAQRRQRAAVPSAKLAPAMLLLGAFLGGCAVGPDYAAPETPSEAGWLERGEGLSGTSPGDELGNWWQGFDDPLIETYVLAGHEASKRIDIAAARLAEARALSRAARSSLLPQARADGGYTRFRLSEQSQANPAGLAPRSGELFESGFDASWELDLFGGNRRRNEAGRGRAEAAAADFDDVRLSVTAEIVRAVFELRGAQRRLDVATQNAALQRDTLDLVERRVASGLSPELDALNARAQLEGTRSTLPELEAVIRGAVLRLATLTARNPEQVNADFAVMKPIPKARIVPAVGLKSEVLRRRPDIRAAERALAAATADVGVAVAAFFPRLSLSAAFGWEAFDADDLFDASTEAGGLLGLAQVPLFTGGRLRAELAAADARREASAAVYEQTVLLAVEESEAALTRYSRSLTSSRHLEASAESSARAAGIARQLYESGLSDFLSVLDADRRRLEAEDALAARQTSVGVNLVAVYKSLGAL